MTPVTVTGWSNIDLLLLVGKQRRQVTKGELEGVGAGGGKLWRSVSWACPCRQFSWKLSQKELSSGSGPPSPLIRAKVSLLSRSFCSPTFSCLRVSGIWCKTHNRSRRAGTCLNMWRRWTPVPATLKPGPGESQRHQLWRVYELEVDDVLKSFNYSITDGCCSWWPEAAERKH